MERQRLVNFPVLNAWLLVALINLAGSLPQADFSAAAANDDGSWPFNDRSTCQKVKTRDSDYDSKQNGKTESSEDGGFKYNVPLCGFNIFSEDKSTQETDFSKTEEQRNTDASPDLAESFRAYLAEIFPSLYGPTKRKRRHAGHYEKRRDFDENKVHDLEEELKHISRVVGGIEAEEGKWPWIAAIGTKSYGLRCGGSLIADRWILTAAHCFKDEEDPCMYNVRLGSNYWRNDTSGHVIDVTPDAIIRHPDYDETKSISDVALLRLKRSVTMDATQFINSICLPGEARSVAVGTTVLAAGWGEQNQKRSRSTAEAISEVEIPVLSYKGECGEYDADIMQPGMICAGYIEGGKDTCQGDSGGPLVYKKDGQWFQLGITSFGVGCARTGYPGIYTDVGYHLRWIKSVISRYSQQ